MALDIAPLEIALEIVRLDVIRGHLKWKVSDLARGVGVSRPLIYYYFGRTKLEIIKGAIELISQDYYAFSGPRQNMAHEGLLLESVLATRKILERAPQLAAFYQRWRFENSVIGDQLKEIESRYQKKLENAFPHLKKPQVLSLHANLHGIVTAPFLNENDLTSSLEGLIKEYGLSRRLNLS
jgi:AcrR family transcriptional regulator